MGRSLAILLALASAPAWAQDVQGPYLGIGVGLLDYRTNKHRIDFEDTAASFKLTGGYRVNDLLSFEGYYSRTEDYSIGRSDFLFPFTSPSGPVGGDVTARLEGYYEVKEIRLLLHAPYVLAGIGYFSGDFSGNLVGSSSMFGPFEAPASDSEQGVTYIVGVQWSLERLRLRAEYEYFETEDPISASTLAFVIQYGF